MQKPYLLNSFQQMMLKWNVLAPYNAGHVMHLVGQPDHPRWKSVILSVIQTIGLGKPQFFKNGKVLFNPIHFIPVALIDRPLDEYIQNQLNSPFELNEFPMRFFILCDSPNSFYLGAIYNHWVADSYSMRALFQMLYQRYYHPTTQNSDGSLPSNAIRLDDHCFKSIFKKFLGRMTWLTLANKFFSSLFNFQNAYRMKANNIMDFHTHFERFYLSDFLIQKLIAYSIKKQVSINDIFLTVLAQVLGNFTKDARQQQKRKKLRFAVRNRLAIGTIVDIRSYAQDRLENYFGQYLSNFTIFLKNPELQTFDNLLKIIHQKTGRIKKSFATIKNYLNWDLLLFIWRLLKKPKRQARFFNKTAPIIAGISNVNLTPSWIGENTESKNGYLLDYIRISPTGLLLPLTFTVTTIHERLSVCISYRRAVFSKENIAALFQDFETRLENIDV